MRVAKWGNSLAVRLPVALVQELGIADGDELLLQPLPRQVKRPATLTVARQPGKLEQLQAIRSLRAVAHVLATANAPMPLAALEASLKGKGPWKKGLPRILETLEVLGRARREGVGAEQVWRA